MSSAVMEAPRPARKRVAAKLDREAALADAKRGLLPGDIAAKQGVTRTTVWRFLQYHRDNIPQVSYFKENRADVFVGIQAKALEVQSLVLDSLKADADNGMLAALGAGQKAQILTATNVIAGTIFDKERLERGESTQNISTVSRMLDSRLGGLHKRKSLTTNKVDEAER